MGKLHTLSLDLPSREVGIGQHLPPGIERGAEMCLAVRLHCGLSSQCHYARILPSAAELTVKCTLKGEEPEERMGLPWGSDYGMDASLGAFGWLFIQNI